MKRIESILFVSGTGSEIVSGGNFGIEGSLFATINLGIVILLSYMEYIKQCRIN